MEMYNIGVPQHPQYFDLSRHHLCKVTRLHIVGVYLECLNYSPVRQLYQFGRLSPRPSEDNLDTCTTRGQGMAKPDELGRLGLSLQEKRRSRTLCLA